MTTRRNIIIVVILVILVLYVYYNNNSYVTKYTWKQTSENGTIGGGIVSFSSAYSYNWPIIKRENEMVGIVLICFNKRMMVYSLQDKSIGFYMYC